MIINQVISKALLFLTSAILLIIYSGISAASIAGILIGAIILSLGPALPGILQSEGFYIDRTAAHLYKDKSLGRYGLLFDILFAAYIISGFRYQAFLFFVPVLFYDVSAFGFFMSGFMGTAAIIYLCSNLSVGFGALMIIIATAAFAISQENLSVLYFRHEMKSLRDDAAEHQLLIEEHNRRLKESQDASIYMATLKERNRIAREIHDNVGHMLTRSILQAGAIRAINRDERLNPHIDALSDTLNTAMDKIRTSVHDLHDESIDLKTAVTDILKPVTSFDTSLEYDMESPIPGRVKYCFINIIQEAVNNTIKHSNGNSIKILLREHPSFYQMMVLDNGSDINMETSGGIGLKNISDRVNSLSGNLKIDTENGFKILVTIMK